MVQLTFPPDLFSHDIRNIIQTTQENVNQVAMFRRRLFFFSLQNGDLIFFCYSLWETFRGCREKNEIINISHNYLSELTIMCVFLDRIPYIVVSSLLCCSVMNLPSFISLTIRSKKHHGHHQTRRFTHFTIIYDVMLIILSFIIIVNDYEFRVKF